MIYSTILSAGMFNVCDNMVLMPQDKELCYAHYT